MSVMILDDLDFVYLARAASALSDRYGGLSWWHKGRWVTLGKDVDEEYVVRMLLEANVAAYNARYAENENTEFDRRLLCADWPHIELLRVIKIARLLEYNCDGLPGWEQSEAAAFLKALVSKAILALPGYEEVEPHAPEPVTDARNLDRCDLTLIVCGVIIQVP